MESMPSFLGFGSGPRGANVAVLVAKAESKTATKQHALESRPEQAFTIYKLII